MNEEVILYGSEDCPWCNKTREYLKDKEIEFEERDVKKQSKNMEELIDKSDQRGIPVIDFKGTIIVGFDKDALDKATMAICASCGKPLD